MNCPCKNCPDKGCGDRHDTCESYQAWSAERQERNRISKMEKDHAQLSDQQTHKHWRNLKLGRTVSRR